MTPNVHMLVHDHLFLDCCKMISVEMFVGDAITLSHMVLYNYNYVKTTHGVLFAPMLSSDVCCMVCGGVSPGEQLPSLKPAIWRL